MRIRFAIRYTIASVFAIIVCLASFTLTADETKLPTSEKNGDSGCLLSDEIQRRFVIIIPSYQNRSYFQKNLDSVFAQNYQNYRVIYIDDASPDGTGALVESYLKSKDRQNRATLIKNERREGSLANIYKAVLLCRPDEIIVNLDGDDWLAGDQVIHYLNRAYADPNVWATYGQFEFYPCGTKGFASQIPSEIIERNEFRNYAWVTTALRSFYAALFHRIEKADLLCDGRFFPAAGDLAYMWPIVEMAGTHSRFTPDVLYIYNNDTPMRDIVINPDLQKKMGLIIKEKTPYKPLPHLF